MKKQLVLIGFLLLSSWAIAQQDPYYTHFKFNKLAFNPATAGEKDDYICATALSHYQWRGYNDYTAVRGNEPNPEVGLTEQVAPNTLAFTLGAPISFGQNPTQRNKMGIGLTFINDEVAFEKNVYFNLALNYRISLQRGLSYLAIGANAGMTQSGYPNPKFIVRDDGDGSVPTAGMSGSAFDAGAGIYYKAQSLGSKIKDFYAGYAMTHIPAPSISLATGGSGGGIMRDFTQHSYLHLGGDIPLTGTGTMVLEPAMMIKYQTKPQIDVNCTVLWSNTLRGGLGYRQWATADAISLMLGYERPLGKVSGADSPNYLRVGYSYDITTSNIQNASNGTHEIFVGYCFKLPTVTGPPKIKIRTPRFL